MARSSRRSAGAKDGAAADELVEKVVERTRAGLDKQKTALGMLAVGAFAAAYLAKQKRAKGADG